MLNVIIFGKPGSGKGTQAAMIKDKYGLIHISTGDVFRKNTSEATELGNIAKQYMSKGELVPDKITITKEPLPRNVNGKITKAPLRERALEEL